MVMRKAIATATASLLLAAGAASAQSGATDWTAPGPFTIGAEALLWWLKASPTPVPVITDGLYGRPDTSVLLGGGTLDTNVNSGFRLTASYAVNQGFALEGNFLFIAQRSTSQSVASSGLPGSTDLLLPFFDVNRNREDITEISFAPVYNGSAKVELTNSMMGAEANAAWAMASERPWGVGVLGGFRWLQLKEHYSITTSSPANPPQAPDIWNTNDSFDAHNNFYGAQVGARARYDQDRWFAGGALKLGVGAMVQSVDVDGSLVTNDFTTSGATQTFAGGYFALPTNIGSHSRTVFAVVPEFQLNVGYRITGSASLFAGYSMLYASSVARPGNQINRNINPTQSVSYVGAPPVSLQGPAQPAFNFNSSDFWAQGFNIGISFVF
jgi:Putative beta barrel porin-7 (BBP7)